jgi:glutaminyl-tRNA synthetase
MLTIRGLRRRGYTSEAIRAFCERIGVAKFNSTIDMAWLEDAIREDLNNRAPRAMAVLRPLKVVIENYPERKFEDLEAVNHPQRPELGSRSVPFSREIYIERDDFMDNPPKKFFRLAPGREVRLRYAYLITCNRVEYDPATGEPSVIYCSYDPQSRGGNAPDGRKVKGTIHWVSAVYAQRAEIRLYDRLFNVPNPGSAEDFRVHLNPASVEIVRDALIEPDLSQAAPGSHFQFERLGYFCADMIEHREAAPVFNRAVGLRDTWAAENQQ